MRFTYGCGSADVLRVLCGVRAGDHCQLREHFVVGEADQMTNWRARWAVIWETVYTVLLGIVLLIAVFFIGVGILIVMIIRGRS